MAIRAASGKPSTTAAQTVAIKKDVSATEYTIISATLAPGHSLQYSEDGGWAIFDSLGNLRRLPAERRIANDLLALVRGIQAGRVATTDLLAEQLGVIPKVIVTLLANLTDDVPVNLLAALGLRLVLDLRDAQPSDDVAVRIAAELDRVLGHSTSVLVHTSEDTRSQ